MSTLRVSNIEAKADVSSPSVHEKVKVTNSQGDVLIHIDGSTSGITTVGINTTGSSFDIDINQNVTFAGIITAQSGIDVTDGSVGIGTDNTTKKLHVVDARSSTYEIVSKFVGGNGTDAIAGISLVSSYSDTANDNEGHVTLTSSREGNGNRSAFTVITADDASTSTEKIRITSDGKVGVGTDAPTQLITVGAAITTGLFEMRAVAGGFDVNVSSGDFAPHYQDNLIIYNGQPGSGAERLRLSTEGYLTVPNQPAFFAHFVGTDTTVNNGSIIVWSSTRFNRGGHYSTSTGKFTAPVAGVYCFQAQIWAKNSGTNHSRAQFHKNGTGRSQNGFHYGTVNSTVDHAFEMTILEDMAVGDQMDIRPDNTNLTFYAGNTNQAHSYFTGFLVG